MRRFAVNAQIFESLLRFLNARNVSGRHPPERECRLSRMMKPLLAVLPQFAMRALINVIAQMLDRFPHRKVEEYCFVLVRPEIGFVGGQAGAPDEARTAVRQFVDLLDPR